MKLIALMMTIALSTSAFAAIPVTEAFKKILPAGTYSGVNCSVTVVQEKDFVSVLVTDQNGTDGFAALNVSPKTYVNVVTGEISASQSIGSPYYLRGGTKMLNVKTKSSDEVAVAITRVLLDHEGNDESTYTECVVSR